MDSLFSFPVPAWPFSLSPQKVTLVFPFDLITYLLKIENGDKQEILKGKVNLKSGKGVTKYLGFVSPSPNSPNAFSPVT